MLTMTKSLALLRIAFFITILLVIPRFSSTATSEQSEQKRSNENSMTERFENWLQKYGRVYGSKDEWNFRFGIYQSNVQFIDSINNQDLPYKLTDNKFADLTKEEFKEKYLGYKMNTNQTYPPSSYSTVHNYTVPEAVDWIKSGAVNPPRNQSPCGSCWTFTTVASIEGITKIKTGKLPALSEQALLDCDLDGQSGCQGGHPEKAYEFVIKNKGIPTRANYPYIAKQGKCNTDKMKDLAGMITSYKKLPPNDEKAIEAIAANQPLTICIDADDSSLVFYKKGVYTGPCTTKLNHGVNIVGYDTDPKAGKYWLVRNSWGIDWGDQGNFKMQKFNGKPEGLCGMAKRAMYPII